MKNIADEKAVDCFGPREVAQKNIRSAYYQEKKKINDFITSGATADEIYQPKVPRINIVGRFLKNQ